MKQVKTSSRNGKIQEKRKTPISSIRKKLAKERNTPTGSIEHRGNRSEQLAKAKVKSRLVKELEISQRNL